MKGLSRYVQYSLFNKPLLPQILLHFSFISAAAGVGWYWGWLDRRMRVVLPSCVVLGLVFHLLQTLPFCWTACLPGKSIFARPKMIGPSWPKVVRPVADGKYVATRGLSIGLLLASFFQDSSLHWYDCYNGYMIKTGIGELI